MPTRRQRLPKWEFIVALILSLVSVLVYTSNFSPAALLDITAPRWVWLLLVVGGLFAGAYLVASGEKAAWWTKKRALNAAVFVLFLIAFVTVVSISNDDYGKTFIHESGASTGYLSYSLQVPGEPRLMFQLSVKLSGIGGLSAGKDIYMQVYFRNVSPADFNKTYCCLAIVPEGALNIPPPLYLSPVPPTLNSSALPFTYNYVGNGTYYTDGHFYVLEPTPIWVAFGNPHWNQTQVYAAIRGQLTPVANVTGTISDAQSVTLSEIGIKVGFIFGSFSILFVQPVLEDLLLDEREAGH